MLLSSSLSIKDQQVMERAIKHAQAEQVKSVCTWLAINYEEYEPEDLAGAAAEFFLDDNFKLKEPK